MDFEFKENYGFYDLVKIMSLLRSPKGCPWDIEQTHLSIRQNFIEETYEAIEAIDTGDSELLKEELGDVMLQVVFHSQIETEAGVFDIDGVCDGVCKKLIERHPHVFADVVAKTPEEVLRNWDKIKMEKKSQKTVQESIDGISKWLPALIYAEKVLKKKSKYGQAEENSEAVANSIKDTVDELLRKEQADKGVIESLIGKALFDIVNIARLHGIDCEKALYDSI